MAYSNSPLVSYTKLSPNHSGQRTHSIDRITPHCVVGQLSAESICGCFASTSRQASCNYGIGKDGKISLCVEEKNRSWCSSSNANDQRAITIECASDKSEPYAMNSAVYASLIKLCTDICQRNGKRKLLWLGDKNKTLNYAPASDEMVLTVHRWYANKSCPGDWLYARLGDLAEKVTAALNDSPGLQAADLENLTRAETVAKIGPLFTANQKTTGILACVSMAQFILESSYGSSELARKANNCFGMKTSLSGNSWPNSVWDGKSVYTKKTQEQNAEGSYVMFNADFRKYTCVEDSIADHAAYLLGAMNGSKKRYESLAGCTDYKKAAQIIKDGGYATSHDYVQNLCSIIEQWNLTKFNSTTDTTISGWYRVRAGRTLHPRRGRSVTSPTQSSVRMPIRATVCLTRRARRSIRSRSPLFRMQSVCPSATSTSAKVRARTMQRPGSTPERVYSPLWQNLLALVPRKAGAS